MSIEIIKDSFKVEELKGRVEVQTLVETEAYINTEDNNFKDITWIEARVQIVNTMVIKDKLLVNGLVKYNIVYRDKEDGVHSLDAIKDFSDEISIRDIKEDMISNVEASVEYIEHELDENRVEIRTLVNMVAEVIEVKTVETIKDIKGRDDLELLRETINYEEVYGREESFADIREVIKLDKSKDSIERVLKFALEPKVVESTVVDNRIVVAGELELTLIYIGDEEVYSIIEAMPFNHFLEIPGALKDSKAEVKLEVTEGIYDIMEDEMGELNIIDIEAKVRVSGRAYEDNTKRIITDTYSTKEELTLEKENIKMLENISNLSFKENINFNAEINAIDILNIRTVHKILEKKLGPEGILIEGNIEATIYYIDRIGGDLAMFQENYPYKTNIDYELSHDDLLVSVGSQLEDLTYNLKRDSAQLTCNINHDISLRKERRVQGLKDLDATGQLIDKKSKASITVYIVQKDDILWDIAKRYNTTSKEILSSNDLDDKYVLKAGDKIVIEKNLDKYI